MASIMPVTVRDIIETDGTFINDETDFTIINEHNRPRRGRWYEDKMLDLMNREVEYVGFHVAKNSVQIILKGATLEKK